tara:strand:+ start:322 stop:462 length:141 start_codon:yes stop_codon:yes gene_type:complete
MSTLEIAQEMLEYFNEHGQYQDFLNWAEQRGFDIEELEASITENIG